LGSKDIVVIGAVMSWEMMEGQRGTQLVNEFLKMGHRVLYVEIDPSRNQQSYNTDSFRLVNVLPRHWAFYDMESKRSTKTAVATHRLSRFMDRIANTSFGRRILFLLPRSVHNRVVSARKAVSTPIEVDLPIIRENMMRALEDFCRPASNRVAIYEIPMRGYVECLDILKQWGFKVVYEFIDKWELMWQGEKIRRLEDEQRLVEAAEIVTVTSKYLMKEFLELYPWRTDALYLPNAVDRQRFNVASVKGRPADLLSGDATVGYFGSIGEWFDWKTLLFLAKSRPQWAFNIIGQYAERHQFPPTAWKELTSLPNVAALGRKKHQDLIQHLAYWDLCIIPFLDTPVTKGTSPVKLYEYLSAYKPVVSTASDELHGIPYVYLANGREDFLSKCEKALRTPVDRNVVDEFLARNTWKKRAEAILNGWTCYQKNNSIVWERREVQKKNLKGPLSSIIMLSLNTRELTKEAIESIRCHSDSPYELIVVDNGSTDGSRAILQEMEAQGAIYKAVLLDRNRGFAGGNNEGVRHAKGEYYVFVNSDIVVSPNWLSKLTRHFANREVGAVGPVSAYVGSPSFPQRVRFQNEKAGRLIELRRISGFCVAISRQCFEKVGPWDEDFFPGNFDDDDMSIRIQRAGFKLLCDGDVYVHHRQMSTFKANPELELDKTFWENKRRFETKWPSEPAVITYSEEDLS